MTGLDWRRTHTRPAGTKEGHAAIPWSASLSDYAAALMDDRKAQRVKRAST